MNKLSFPASLVDSALEGTIIASFSRIGFAVRNRLYDLSPVAADLTGRVAIVTGGTSGIGRATVDGLMATGAKVYLTSRSQERADEAAKELNDSGSPGTAVGRSLDTGDFDSIRAFADQMASDVAEIDMLINNAGALFNPRQQTPEGFEKSFALLLLSPYILTERLQPLLSVSPDARVVNVLSGGMYSQKIRVNDLQSKRGEYSGSVAYARAKRGLMIVTEEWAKRWRSEGIVVNAMHPGWADTPGVETALPGFYRLTKHLLRTPEEGADTAVWLAAATEAGKVTGKFWLDRERHPSHLSQRTRETPGERRQLLETLADLLETTREKKPRRRSKASA